LAIKENWCLSFSCIFGIKKRTGAYRFLVFWALKRSGTHLSLTVILLFLAIKRTGSHLFLFLAIKRTGSHLFTDSDVVSFY